MSEQGNVAHKARRSGVKADKKKSKDKGTHLGLTQSGTKQKNLKAFTFSNIIAAQRDRLHAAEAKQKREHSHMDRKDLVDRPPPYVVAISGPPGSGKTTLMKCLIKHYTRMPSFDCVGPVTISVSRDKRVTFIEVNNDIGAMIDIAKIADLVLLTIDASFGFELETFEFLNILKQHGFPKVMGVLTHVDAFRNNKILSNVKSRLKKRFWQEICDGAKLFHLSGLIHGRYPKREILNLARFITTTKYKPQTFRNDHPYVVVDRVEDMTHPGLINQNPVCDRTVALYGYVRGTSMKPGTNVHLLGVGDFQIKDIERQDDPLPLLTHYNIRNKKNGDGNTGTSLTLDQNTLEYNKKQRRLLKKQDVKIHAPFSSIGNVLYDKDAIYIKMRQHKIRNSSLDDISVLGSKAHHSEDDIARQTQHLKEQLAKGQSIENAQFVQDLHTNTRHNIDTFAVPEISLFKNSSSSVQAALSRAEAVDNAISLFGNKQGSNNTVTDNQFDELHQLRKGSTALPESVQHDNDNDEQDNDDDGNDDDELYGNVKDDVYNNMQIREIVGSDGKVRRQVVFGKDTDITPSDLSAQPDSDDDDRYDLDDDDLNNNDDDDQDDYNPLYDDDDDDGYYSDDDDDKDNTLEDDDYVQLGNKKSIKKGHDNTDDDEDDYDDDDDEDHDDGDEEEDNGFDTNDVSSYFRTSVSSRVDPDESSKKQNKKSSSSTSSAVTSQFDSNMFVSRSQTASRHINMRLDELVYGPKPTLAQLAAPSSSNDNTAPTRNTDALSFFTSKTRQPEDVSDSDNDNDGNNSQEDDFFIMRKNVSDMTKESKISSHLQKNSGDNAFASTTGALTSNKIHENEATSKNKIDKKSAQNMLFSNNDNKYGANNTIDIYNLYNQDNDTSMILFKENQIRDWSDTYERIESLKNRFVTGDWDEAAERYNGQDDDDEEDGESNGQHKYHDDTITIDGQIMKRSEVFGIKDTNESWGSGAFSSRPDNRKKKSSQHGKSDSFLDDDDNSKVFDHNEELYGDFETYDDDGNVISNKSTEDKVKSLIEQKMEKKKSFFEQLEKEAEQDKLNDKLSSQNRGEKKQALNKLIMRDHYDYFQAQRDALLKRVQNTKIEMSKLSPEDQMTLFGAMPGTYVRILLTQVPCEFIEYLDPTYPVILGGLLPSEQNLGFINMRVKKHRWHHRLLKSNDPLIFSSGWRRFQSIPVYYLETIQQNYRYLKYTPEHLHCLCTMYGPLTAINTGIIAFKNVYSASKSLNGSSDTLRSVSFRVALTGVVLDVDKKVEIRKKLKLMGTPLQIFNKTAYIQGMFNSALEVAKFEQTKISSVSGIPGRIVKAVTHAGKEGVFRANFNDKILKSDLIICKTFTNIKIYKYYNPVTSLLLQIKAGWKGMRTRKEMRADSGQIYKPNGDDYDNQYHDIQREKRKFNALQVPKSLEAALPISAKNKVSNNNNGKTAMAHNKYDKVRKRFMDKQDTSKKVFIDKIREIGVDKMQRARDNAILKQKKKENETKDNRERIERGQKKARKAAIVQRAKQSGGK